MDFRRIIANYGIALRNIIRLIDFLFKNITCEYGKTAVLKKITFYYAPALIDPTTKHGIFLNTDKHFVIIMFKKAI